MQVIASVVVAVIPHVIIRVCVGIVLSLIYSLVFSRLFRIYITEPLEEATDFIRREIGSTQINSFPGYSKFFELSELFIEISFAMTQLADQNKCIPNSVLNTDRSRLRHHASTRKINSNANNNGGPFSNIFETNEESSESDSRRPNPLSPKATRRLMREETQNTFSLQSQPSVCIEAPPPQSSASYKTLLTPNGNNRNNLCPTNVPQVSVSSEQKSFMKAEINQNLFQTLVSQAKKEKVADKGKWGVVKETLIQNWKKETMLFVGFHIQYRSINSSSCCTNVAKIHAMIFEKIKLVSQKLHTFWEWAGNSECVVYWPKSRQTSLVSLLDIHLVLRDIEMRNAGTFRWAMAITEGAARCGKIKSTNILSDVAFSEARDRALAMAQFALSVKAGLLCEETTEIDDEGMINRYVKMPCWVVDQPRDLFGIGKTDDDSEATERDEIPVTYCVLRSTKLRGYTSVWKSIQDEDWKQAACDIATLVKTNQEDHHLRCFHNHISGVWKKDWLFELSFDRQPINVKKSNESLTQGDVDGKGLFTNSIRNPVIEEDAAMLSAEDLETEFLAWTDFFVFSTNKLSKKVIIGNSRYEGCFSSKELADWMIKRLCIEISCAVEVGELMRNRKVIVHVSDQEDTFKYGKLLFRLTDAHSGFFPCPDDISWNARRIKMLLRSILREEENRQGRLSELEVVVTCRNKKKYCTPEQEELDLLQEWLAQFRAIWSILRLLVILQNSLVVPLFVGYYLDYTIHFAVLQWVADLVVYPCVYLEYKSITEKSDDPTANNGLKRLLKQYRPIIIIVMSCFPLEILACIVDQVQLFEPRWRLNRLIGLLSFVKVFSNCQDDFFAGVNPIFVQIGKYLLVWSIALILLSSAFHYVIFKYEDAEQAVDFLKWPELRDASPFFRLIACIDWTTRAVVGYACRWPVTDAQYAIVLLSQSVGLIAWTTIIAYSHALLLSLNPSKKEYEELVQNVKEYFTGHKVPHSFIDEVLSYIRMLWNTSRTYTTAQYDYLFDTQESHGLVSSWTLPEELRYEFLFHLNMHVVKQLPWLSAHCQCAEFMFDFVSNLRLQIYMPNTMIIEYGEPGEHFFIIVGGNVRVKYPEISETIHNGDFFGEMPIVYDMPSPITATSIDVVSVYSIRAAAFLTACENHTRRLAPVLLAAETRMAHCARRTSVVTTAVMGGGMDDECELPRLLSGTSSKSFNKSFLLSPHKSSKNLKRDASIRRFQTFISTTSENRNMKGSLSKKFSFLLGLSMKRDARKSVASSKLTSFMSTSTDGFNKSFVDDSKE